jgi:hypothetical protein
MNALLHGVYSTPGLCLNSLDHLTDLAGGSGGPLGQGPHLIGNDRKTAALLTGAGRFNRGVQSQQIG